MVFFALFVLVPGYILADDKILTIDPRNIVAVQNMRSEITAMLESLGYASQPVLDPSTGQPVTVAEKFGQYRMLFRAVDNVSVQINVHIRKDNHITALHFSKVSAEQPDDVANDYYQKLKQRVVMEFGADNVSDKHSFFTP